MSGVDGIGPRGLPTPLTDVVTEPAKSAIATPLPKTAADLLVAAAPSGGTVVTTGASPRAPAVDRRNFALQMGGERGAWLEATRRCATRLDLDSVATLLARFERGLTTA